MSQQEEKKNIITEPIAKKAKLEEPLQEQEQKPKFIIRKMQAGPGPQQRKRMLEQQEAMRATRGPHRGSRSLRMRPRMRSLPLPLPVVSEQVQEEPKEQGNVEQDQ